MNKFCSHLHLLHNVYNLAQFQLSEAVRGLATLLNRTIEVGVLDGTLPAASSVRIVQGHGQNVFAYIMADKHSRVQLVGGPSFCDVDIGKGRKSIKYLELGPEEVLYRVLRHYMKPAAGNKLDRKDQQQLGRELVYLANKDIDEHVLHKLQELAVSSGIEAAVPCHICAA